LRIEAVDYHTAGEPFRIVTGGVRPLRGETILARRRDALEHLDEVRRLLVFEPRGHADMYGCFVTEPEDAGGDLGVVFFHNEGYSTACGHGTIALVTWALESGRLDADEVVVDAPSGRLHCTARRDGRRVTGVRFRNVPSFVLATGVSAGGLELDVAFGGAFYASVDVGALGLAVEPRHLPELIALQRELRPAVEAELDVVHPLEPELRGIYGVIFHEDEPGGGQRNVAVFADGEVDRSPCGSGTSARLALLHAQGRIAVGRDFRHVSIVGTEFRGRIVETTEVAGRPAVVTEVEGSAHLTGRHEFVLDPDDPLGTGFLLR
jgi:proline racemase/trans-L-3-hydroxyproline dehydratase